MNNKTHSRLIDEFGYVVKNNICLFQRGPLSQWWGGFNGQNGGFSISRNNLYSYHRNGNDVLTKFEKTLGDSNGVTFNCCEQWMMAIKAILFNDLDSLISIMKEKSPQRQKFLGRKIKNYDDKVWNEYKFRVVLDGNSYKFEQNPELKEFLLSFNKFTIFAEAAPWDSVWGTGLAPEDPRSLDINQWQGENLLGLAISKVRKEL